MAYNVLFSKEADRGLEKLDQQIRIKVVDYLEKVASSEDPKAFAKPLKHKFKGLWRYRIGDYRVICEIKDKEFVIFAISIDHRRKVYE